MKNFLLNLFVFLLLPALIFLIIGNYFYLDRGLISLDLLALLFLRNKLGATITAILFILLFCIDFLVSLSSAFLFHLEDFYFSVKYFLSFPNAPVILLISAILLGLIFIIVKVLLNKSRVSKSNKIVFAVMCLFLVVADFLNNTNMLGPKANIAASYNVATSGIARNVLYFYRLSKRTKSTITEVNPPFRQSMQKIWANIQLNPLNDKPNIILIIMESFGLNSDSTAFKTILNPLKMLKNDYDIRIFKERFFGGTVPAETKELLGLVGVRYYDIKNIAKLYVNNSVPYILSKYGYTTIGIHGFTEMNFDRYIWWNKIGLQKTIFINDLHKKNRDLIGTIFRGAFDIDALEYMSNLEKDLNDQKKPYFIYLLTLNAHLSLSKDVLKKYGIDQKLSVSACLDSIQTKIVSKIVAVANKSQNTIFFMVGDHTPPIVGTQKKLYNQSYVPLILICPSKYKFSTVGINKNDSCFTDISAILAN